MQNSTFSKRLAEAMKIRELTQTDLHERTGINKSSISTYLRGDYKAKQDKVDLLSSALGVSPAWLMGYDVPMEPTAKPSSSLAGIKNIVPIERRMVPVIGTIAAGQPIYADEHIEAWVPCDARCHVDFGLKVQGDSMIEAGIEDGYIVFIQKVDDVDDGQMAAVCVDDEATLKYVFKEPNGVTLNPANRRYRPMYFDASNCDNIRIIGRAVAKFSWID